MNHTKTEQSEKTDKTFNRFIIKPTHKQSKSNFNITHTSIGSKADDQNTQKTFFDKKRQKSNQQQEKHQLQIQNQSNFDEGTIQSQLIFFSPKTELVGDKSLNSALRCFTPFSQFVQFQQQFFQNTKGQSYQSVIQKQLVHNQYQMKSINYSTKNEQESALKSFLNNLKIQKIKDEKIRHFIKQYDKKEQQEMKNVWKNNNGQQPVQSYINPEKKTIEESFDDNGLVDDIKDLQIKWTLVQQDLDPSRPTFREGAVMVEYKDQLYLYSGIGRHLLPEIHQYNIETNVWKNLKIKGDCTHLYGRFGHTGNIYKNYLVTSGGQSGYNVKLKMRECKNEICFFCLDTFEFTQFKTKGSIIEHRRNHMAAIVGNEYIMVGGVNGVEEYLSSVFTINLETQRCKQYVYPDQSGIAFATMYPIFKKFMPKFIKIGKTLQKIKSLKFKEEGIYIFGGKNSKGDIKNKIQIIKLDEKYQPVDYYYPEIQGILPPARYSHTMEFYAPMNGLLVYGGKNDKIGQIYDDMWLLHLKTLTWMQISIKNEIQRNRFSHCSAIFESKIYIFGGLHQERYATWDLHFFELDPLGYLKKKAQNNKKQQISVDHTINLRANTESVLKNFIGNKMFSSTLAMVKVDSQK